MVTKDFMTKASSVMEEVMSQGHVEAIEQIDDKDAVVHQYPFPDTKGIENIERNLESMTRGFSDRRFEWQEMISEGNTWAARYTMRMKHTGNSPMFQVPPTGKEVTLQGSLFAHFENGKDVEIYQYDDWLGFMQQLGMIPNIEQKE